MGDVLDVLAKVLKSSTSKEFTMKFETQIVQTGHDNKPSPLCWRGFGFFLFPQYFEIVLNYKSVRGKVAKETG